jgi:cytochrome c peroxidase
MKFLRLLCWIGLAILGHGCKRVPASTETIPALMEIPQGFPEINFPEGNEFSLERWQLGKKLFFEKRLSNKNSVSCASCHQPGLAFSDKVAFSTGEENSIGRSNAPSLTNIAYHPYFTRAGGVPTLEMQVLVPIQEHDEFNTNIVDLAEKLKKIPGYAEAARIAYNRELDPYVITRAIANFERSLISGNSSFDQFAYRGNEQILNAAEKNGLKLFYSEKTNCAKCHSGFNFSNYEFKNNGLYEVYSDSGRKRLTKLPADEALFKVPGLRNVALTAPYMHDGSFKTLEEVIAHYNRGGHPHVNKSELIKPLYLSEKEQADLLAFLKSLTDLAFITNSNFRE